jgi:hypothetical protein
VCKEEREHPELSIVAIRRRMLIILDFLDKENVD